MASSFGSDWRRILDAGGIPDSPGREEAIIAAKEVSRRKAEQKTRPKARSRSASKPTTFPSLKHAKDVM